MTETFECLDLSKGEFCSHNRLLRVVASAHYILWGMTWMVSDLWGRPICPICGRFVATRTSIAHVLTVVFHDGTVSEFRFRHARKSDCYRISESALHIYLEDATVSYDLDLVESINFGRLAIPPDPPEVMEAERIINGQVSRSH